MGIVLDARLAVLSKLEGAGVSTSFSSGVEGTSVEAGESEGVREKVSRMRWINDGFESPLSWVVMDIDRPQRMTLPLLLLEAGAPRGKMAFCDKTASEFRDVVERSSHHGNFRLRLPIRFGIRQTTNT